MSLIAGRLLHTYGASQIKEGFRFRVVGMVLTLGCIISVSVRLIANAII